VTMSSTPSAMNRKLRTSPLAATLRRRAEARLRQQKKNRKTTRSIPKPERDPERSLYELEIHQVELEMQNAELREARNRTEILLEKYTDLYDFAPVGYFSLDQQGRILEVNLTGAALLGVERSRLLTFSFPRFVAAASQPIFRAFLHRVFTDEGEQVCEAALLKQRTAGFWASLHGTSAIAISDTRKWCRVAVSDITFVKQAEEAQHRMETLAVANRDMKEEIARRLEVEQALKKSERHSRFLLTQSHRMQDQLRLLSRQLLLAQEEERKKISRELHDVIAQTLTGINVRLAALKTNATMDVKELERRIRDTQQLVQESVEIVQRFARELRPTVLDDVGLIPALHTFMKSFREQTGIRVSLSAFAAVEQLIGERRTVLFRIAQEALTNIARHAKASETEVNIQKLDGAIRMTIKDDGKGFPAERLLQARKRKRLGLLGMSERLEMVGGTLVVESVPGKGTTIIAQIPLIDRLLPRG
jgi:PAS domain S-box-containing protein